MSFILTQYYILDAVAKRRKFFENYAKEHSFDALNPEHWYSHSRDSLLSTKVFIIYKFSIYI